jgi:predicted nuclease of predicted toxin-antitoxin system
MTLRFLVDEDLPRSTSRALSQAGHDALDIRDTPLRGHSDREVFDLAQSESRVLVTADRGFGNLFQFPVGTHAGIIVLRVDQSLPSNVMNATLLQALAELKSDELKGALVVVEVGRVRIRRPKR